jgi:hypothetical protein
VPSTAIHCARLSSGGDHAGVGVHRKYGPPQNKARAVDALLEHGPVDLLRITRSDSLTLEFVIKERNTVWTDVGFFGLAPGDSGRVVSLRMLHVPAGRTPDDAALLEHLRSMRP